MRATKEAGGPVRGDSRPANQCDTAKRHRTFTPPIPSAQPRWRHNSPPHRATSGHLSREVVEAIRDAVDIAEVAAKRAQLELKIAEGGFIAVAEVDRVWFEILRMTRDRMKAIPGRVAARLVR